MTIKSSRYAGLAVTAMFLSLAACSSTPTEFGVPQSQFNQLTNQQKSAVIKEYNAQQVAQAKQGPLDNLVSDAFGVFAQKSHIGKNYDLGHSSSGPTTHC